MAEKDQHRSTPSRVIALGVEAMRHQLQRNKPPSSSRTRRTIMAFFVRFSCHTAWSELQERLPLDRVQDFPSY